MGVLLSDNNNHLLRFDPNKPLAVGGQAVIEGVMMRAPGRIATAVRRSSGQIIVKKRDYVSLAEKNNIFKLPILRGAVGLVEMMFVGIETLNFSTEVAMQDLKEKARANGNGKMTKQKKSASNLRLALTVMLSLVVGITIFFITPLIITTKLFNVEQTAFGFNVIAGTIRLSILVGYLLVISMMKDVKRLFEYHGAEHKAVFTFESQGALTIDSAARYTRFHPRCGTSFILIVMVISMLLFSILDSLLILWLGKISLLVRMLTHLPLIPLVGGVAYEFIRWSAKRSTTSIGKMLVAPGLWLQRITTKEPDPSQIEVALVALKCALGVEEPQQATYIRHISELVLN
ncbi:MAG: DUF1385 domain-containing protein [Ignavibacteria bacterium]|nr:DUF1385 domain-containing protein [Ignavibacteria bacterium]